MTDAVPQAIADLEIDDERYHRCQTCHTTIDIPLDLYLRLDSGLFQGGREVQLVDLNEDWWVGVLVPARPAGQGRVRRLVRVGQVRIDG